MKFKHLSSKNDCNRANLEQGPRKEAGSKLYWGDGQASLQPLVLGVELLDVLQLLVILAPLQTLLPAPLKGTVLNDLASMLQLVSISSEVDLSRRDKLIAIIIIQIILA